MQFQIYKTNPGTHLKLVTLHILYIWLSAELWNGGNLPLGTPFVAVVHYLVNIDTYTWSFLQHPWIIDILLVSFCF